MSATPVETRVSEADFYSPLLRSATDRLQLGGFQTSDSPQRGLSDSPYGITQTWHSCHPASRISSFASGAGALIMAMCPVASVSSFHLFWLFA
jgi:hypothetical protein